MAGKKITRLREMLAKAEADLASATGTQDEPFAKNRCESVRAELAKEEEHRAKHGKKPRDPSTWNPVAGPRESHTKEERIRRDTAARLIGGKIIKQTMYPTFADTSAVIAAEIAVEGVSKDFAVVKPGAPAPLTDQEFENARGIVATVTANEGGTNLLSEIVEDRDRWLAEAFPSLNENRRVKCARFLSGMATLAADKPSEDAPKGATVVENALQLAGMTYVEFENARMTDAKFNDAQAVIKSARKRCIMDRLEETLHHRALYGQMEENVDRFGERHEVRRIDNVLSFNLLKYGHEQYLKQNIKDKATATAMTLMIAQGNYPQMPKVQEPKQAEVIDVE